MDPSQDISRVGLLNFILIPKSIDVKQNAKSHEDLLKAMKPVSKTEIKVHQDGETESSSKVTKNNDLLPRKRCTSEASPPTTSDDTVLDKLFLQRNKSHLIQSEGKARNLDSSTIARASYSNSSLLLINEKERRRISSQQKNEKLGESKRKGGSVVNFLFACMTDSSCSK